MKQITQFFFGRWESDFKVSEKSDTTVVCIPFSNNKPPVIIFSEIKIQHYFCRINVFKKLLGFFSEKVSGLLFWYLSN